MNFSRHYFYIFTYEYVYNTRYTTYVYVYIEMYNRLIFRFWAWHEIQRNQFQVSTHSPMMKNEMMDWSID